MKDSVVIDFEGLDALGKLLRIKGREDCREICEEALKGGVDDLGRVMDVFYLWGLREGKAQKQLELQRKWKDFLEVIKDAG